MLLQHSTKSVLDSKILRAFLAAGANPNNPSTISRHSMRTDGFTQEFPLFSCANLPVSCAAPCALALLEAGAKVDSRSKEKMSNERGYGQDRSQTALHNAVVHGKLELCTVLLSHGADINAIMTHLEMEHLKHVISPTDDPRDPEWQCNIKLHLVKCTALHLAIKGKDLDMVKFLVLCGADQSIPYCRGSISKSTASLCQDEMTGNKNQNTGLQAPNASDFLHALELKWRMDSSIHRLFPEPFKCAVKSTLLVAQRQYWCLGNSIMHQIFTYLADMRLIDENIRIMDH